MSISVGWLKKPGSISGCTSTSGGGKYYQHSKGEVKRRCFACGPGVNDKHTCTGDVDTSSRYRILDAGSKGNLISNTGFDCRKKLLCLNARFEIHCNRDEVNPNTSRLLASEMSHRKI